MDFLNRDGILLLVQLARHERQSINRYQPRSIYWPQTNFFFIGRQDKNREIKIREIKIREIKNRQDKNREKKGNIREFKCQLLFFNIRVQFAHVTSRRRHVRADRYFAQLTPPPPPLSTPIRVRRRHHRSPPTGARWRPSIQPNRPRPKRAGRRSVGRWPWMRN